MKITLDHHYYPTADDYQPPAYGDATRNRGGYIESERRLDLSTGPLKYVYVWRISEYLWVVSHKICIVNENEITSLSSMYLFWQLL